MDIIQEQEEQNCEFTSAGATPINLDFNIQINESITASSQPTSIPPPPDQILNQFDYHKSLLPIAEASYDQEKIDHKQPEAEEMLRFHDWRFSEELNNRVHDNQWQKIGNRFERPYADGASSSRSIPFVPNNEVFKLYTKGILSKGTEILGNNTILGGIGIALFDNQKQVFFRMVNPLVGMEMVSEVIELNALAEGLSTALELGIKHVSFFTENAELFAYLEGNLKPEHENVASLLDKVTLLFSKFSHFTSVLVDPANVRISTKLALDAIDSQITMEMVKIRNLNSVNCSICMEDINHFKMYYIQDCFHSYCYHCIMQHVEGQLHNGILPKCPHKDCKSILTLENCKQFLSSTTYNIFKDRVREASIPATMRIYCPNPKCSELMSQNEDIANVAMECVKCCFLFCGQCKAPWHNDISCETYAMLYPDQGDAKLKSVATDNMWKQCGNCKTMVELEDGCYHIVCRCGHEFCYTCGAAWENKTSTCRCLLWDEKNAPWVQNNIRRF